MGGRAAANGNGERDAEGSARPSHHCFAPTEDGLLLPAAGAAGFGVTA